MNLAVIGVLTGLSVRKEGGVQGEGVEGGGIPSPKGIPGFFSLL